VHIAAIAPAQLLQALLERCDPGLIVRIVGARGHQHADAPHAVALLCARREGPRCGRATYKFDEVAPLHVVPHLDRKPSTLRLDGELEIADPNARSGSKADIQPATCNVRFTPESGHWSPSYFPDKSSSRISTVRKPSPPMRVVIPA
jgi:hypothetical protein